MKLRVLLVEDEADIRLIARAALIRAGCEVLTAENGSEALTVVVEQHPDLVLLDCMLPILDGFDTCAALKASPATRHIPIVFLTARSKEADRTKCMALGAIGCIAKPFNPLALGDEVLALWRASGQTISGDPPR